MNEFHFSDIIFNIGPVSYYSLYNISIHYYEDEGGTLQNTFNICFLPRPSRRRKRLYYILYLKQFVYQLSERAINFVNKLFFSKPVASIEGKFEIINKVQTICVKLFIFV